MRGKKIIANKLSKKTRLIEDTSSSVLDLITGASDAIAVPPQIAVPATRRIRCFLDIFKTLPTGDGSQKLEKVSPINSSPTRQARGG